jgi:hypothetical protein
MRRRKTRKVLEVISVNFLTLLLGINLEYFLSLQNDENKRSAAT